MNKLRRNNSIDSILKLAKNEVQKVDHLDLSQLRRSSSRSNKKIVLDPISKPPLKIKTPKKLEMKEEQEIMIEKEINQDGIKNTKHDEIYINGPS